LDFFTAGKEKRSMDISSKLEYMNVKLILIRILNNLNNVKCSQVKLIKMKKTWNYQSMMPEDIDNLITGHIS
jgi:hypothetical protein